MGAAASIPAGDMDLVKDELKKPLDASDVATPRGESAKAEVVRLRKLLVDKQALLAPVKEDGEAAAPADAAAPASAGGDDDKAETVKTSLEDVQAAIDAAVAAGKTPVVVDNSKDNKFDTFLGYQTVVSVDCKKVGLMVNKKVAEMKGEKAVPLPQVMDEELRAKLCQAIMKGTPLVLQGQQSATDFVKRFNDAPSDLPEGDAGPDTEGGAKSFFPVDVFKGAGRGLITEDWLKKLYREAELAETSGMHCRKVEDGSKEDTFYTLITTWFSPEMDEDEGMPEFQDFLFRNPSSMGGFGYPTKEQGVPLSNYRFIVIEHAEGTEMR